MSKLDPKLELLLRERQERQARPESVERQEGQEIEEASPEIVSILIKFTGDLAELETQGFQSQAVAGNIATGHVRLADLPAIADHPNVIKIEMSRPLFPELNVSLSSIGVNTVHSGTPAFKGSGVITGVIDSGIDYQHGCFRFADGTSRILFLWDMRPATGAVGAPPTGYSIGIEYTKAQIDAALGQPDPLSQVPHQDKDTEVGHGTHVAGIAAGNGRPEGNCHGSGTYVGVAPEADFVVVCLASDSDELGESANLVNGVDYIFKKAIAENKPAVINISLGDNIGAHDGTSLVEQFIDVVLLLQDGFAVVKSAGNEGEAKHHAQGTITAVGNQDANVQFAVPAGHSGDLIMDVWYEGTDRFDVTVTPPTGTGGGPFSPGTAITFPLANGNALSVNSQLNDPDNNDNRIYIEVGRGTLVNLEPGTWTLNLKATTLIDGNFHAWIERGSNTARFLAPFLSTSSTISVPGTARRVITVGAFADRGTQLGKLTAFSSRGPDRDGLIKPEIVAPGDGIMSVRSSALPQDSACIQLCADMYHPLDGTSMAAPHVTGVVTLMLQKNPSLPIEEIRRHLLDNTTRNPATMGGALPNNNWGHGIINASAAVSAVPAATPLLGPTEPGPANRAEPRLGDSQAPDLGGAIPNISIQRREPSAEWLDRRDKLLQTSLGQKYVDLVRLHIHEARMLIKTNQRVATVWLRNNGPSIMRSLLYILYNPNEPPPNEIGGKSIAESIDRIIAVLKRYGSATLQHDLEQYGTTIHNYLGLSYYQLLARFRSEGAGTAD